MTTRLFHISDVHFGIENRAALDSVAGAIADERPDLLVCTGDLTQRAKHSEYAAAADWFASLGVPVWIDPGNHDMPYYSPIERFTDPYRRYRRLKEAVAVEAFETDDIVLLPLRTTVPAQKRWPWSDGVITTIALEEAHDRLGHFGNDERHVVVTAHHPLHGPSVEGPNATVGGDAAFASLAKAGMNAVLSGHIHKPFNEFRGEGGARAQVIGAGTLSRRLRHGAPPSYNVLTCRKGADEIEVKLRELPHTVR